MWAFRGSKGWPDEFSLFQGLKCQGVTYISFRDGPGDVGMIDIDIFQEYRCLWRSSREDVLFSDPAHLDTVLNSKLLIVLT